MLKKGNGEPMQCVLNLLKMTRGECVYDRIKGLNSQFIDMNSEIAIPLVSADAKWLIQTYEPRVNVENIDINGLLMNEGAFEINVNAKM